MKRLKYIMIILFFASFFLEAQSQIVKGIILDKASQPIKFANIGIVNGKNGTISNEHGFFKIDISNTSRDDTLRFACIGFHSKDYKVSSISETTELEVRLDEKVFPINEIIIKPIKEYKVEFGKSKSHHGGWGFGGLARGFELAQFYKNSKKICLKKFMFHLYSSNYDSVLFRLNIYSDINEKVADNINRDQIFLLAKIKNGWITKELEDYGILIDSNFYISIEAVKGWKSSIENKEEIRISGPSSNRGQTYVRFSSMEYWWKNKGLLDFYIQAYEL